MISVKNLIKSAGVREMNVADVTTPGTMVLANVAVGATPQLWQPDYNVGLVKEQTGIVKAREFIAPVQQLPNLVPGAEFAYTFHNRAESFKDVDYDKLKRANGGEFPYFNSKAEKRVGMLENIGISIVVEKHMAKTNPSFEATLVQRAKDIIERATLRKAYDSLLAVADVMEWDKKSNPDSVLKQAMLAAGNEAGVRPNRILYGDQIWIERDAWLDAQTTAGGFNAPRTEAALSSILRADVLVPDARMENGSGLFPAFAADKILGTISVTGMEDVSNVKTFTDNEGLKIVEWDHPQGELKVITVSRWQAVQTTSDLGAFAISLAA